MMSREIAAQAEILPQCVEPIATQVRRILPLEGRIFAGGCGDSAFAPAALGGVFAALGVDVVPATSMTLASFTQFREDDTVILSSISGGTKRTVEAAQAARAAGARVIAITCGSASALDQTATDTILLPFTPLSRKTPHTLDYAVTLAALVELALAWRSMPPEKVLPLFNDIPSMLAVAAARARDIASRMEPAGKLFLLGAGPDLGSAEYGAAKFHEAGGLVAIAAETENFIHGMNFMVEQQDTLLVLGGNAAGAARGAQVVEGFSHFVTCAEIIGPGVTSTWEESFRSVLSQTFTIQNLCLEIAERRKLALELPRAGRDHGDAHAAIQAMLMAR
ncbi:fructoselysine-6-P-deglycase FrlB-like protein [Rhizobium sp. BK251]|nr:fructoselysine-6-P-deglycase FrlB-like protein [Rhizobium sp. BK251]